MLILQAITIAFNKILKKGRFHLKNIIKKAVLGVVIAILLGIMGACSSSQTDNSAENADTKKSSNYPLKPIEVVVPAGAGGDTDLNTRIMAKYLEKELGTSIVVSNVAGAGGTTGTKKVLDAKPDGYTVLAFHNSLLLNNIFGHANYTYSDYKIAGIGVIDQSNTFVTSKNAKFKDLKSLIDYAKKNPGKVNVATEVGGMTYMQIKEFEKKTGVKFNIVDVGGASDKIAALLGGRVDILPTSLGLIKSYIDSGDFVPLGILADKRLEGAPDVPTFKEQGVDMSIDKVFYWAFPKDTPDEIVKTLSDAMKKVTENKSYQEEIKKSLLEPIFLDSEEATQKLKEIDSQYREVYKQIEHEQ